MVVPIVTLRQAHERARRGVQQYATAHGYEVIVMGNSSAASSRLVRRLARKPGTALIGAATR